MSYIKAIQKKGKEKDEADKGKKVMTDGLFTKFATGKDFFTEEIKIHIEPKKEDMVNSPKHYNQYDIECIDAIQAATNKGFEYYLQGNIIKYMWRYDYKNGIEDLKKAQWYLNKLIEVKNDSS